MIEQLLAVTKAQPQVLLLGGVFAGTVLLTFWALSGSHDERREMQRRLERMVRERGTQPLATAGLAEPFDPEAGTKAGRAWRQALFEQADRFLEGSAWTERIAEALRRADLKLQVSEFITIAGAVAAMVTLLGLYALGLAGLLLGGILGIWLPSLYLRQRAGARLKAFNAQLPDALALIANALRAGHSFQQALEVAAREMPAPLAVEFAQVLREVRVNIALEDALANLTRRIPSDDLDLIVTAVLIQRQVGGNLAEVLDKIGHTIRLRVRIHGQIKTLTAQGRISGWIVSLLPIALGAILSVLNPSYMAGLFQNPIGWVLIGVGAVMQLVGILVIRAVVAVEV